MQFADDPGCRDDPDLRYIATETLAAWQAAAEAFTDLSALALGNPAGHNRASKLDSVGRTPRRRLSSCPREQKSLAGLCWPDDADQR